MTEIKKTPKTLWIGVTRLASALVVVSPESGYMALVGETKEPVDFSRWGLMNPEISSHDHQAGAYPMARLRAIGPVRLSKPKLFLSFESSDAQEDKACAFIAQALLIRRNGSVSERLWNLVCESSPEISALAQEEAPPWVRQVDGARDLTWLCSVPVNIWDIVRDTVLRCS